MSDFIVEHLTKSVGDKTVFRDISFIMHDYDRIGIIGVNGTGKTTLLDVISGRLGFDGDVSQFSAKNGYKIAYLTQEPDFDDNKTILDTVLSSDLREMALIKTYEQLMADYNESNQAQLEKVMAEMDSLDAWTIESEVKTVLTKLGLHDLSLVGGDLSGGLRGGVQVGAGVGGGGGGRGQGHDVGLRHPRLRGHRRRGHQRAVPQGREGGL